MTVLRVGVDFFVNADDIGLVQPWRSGKSPTRAAKKLRARAEEREVFHDATGGRPTLSLILLKNGWVIASPYQPKTLIQRALVRAVVKQTTRRDALQVDAQGRAILEAPQVLEGVRELPALPEAPSSAPPNEVEPDDDDGQTRGGIFGWGRRRG